MQINEVFLISLKADVFSYLYGYNADSELFGFWHWNYFYQLSEMYDSHGDISEVPYKKFLLRFLIILNCFHSDYAEKFLNELKSNNNFLNNQTGIHFLDKTLNKDFKEFIGELLSCSEIGFLQTIKVWTYQVCTKLQFNLVSENIEFKDENDFNNNLDERYFELNTINRDSKYKGENIRRYESMIDTGRLALIGECINENSDLDMRGLCRDTIVQRFVRVEQMTNVVEERFKIGENFNYDNSTPIENIYKDNSTLYLQILSFGYLKLIRDLITNGNEGNSLLLRYKSDKGETGKRQGEVHMLDDLNDLKSKFSNKILFDPMGGIITKDIVTRRLYYKYRSVVFSSLWDFSLKIKKQLFHETRLNS